MLVSAGSPGCRAPTHSRESRVLLSSISGIENLPQAVKFLIAFAIISMLLVLFALVLRRLTGGRLTLSADRGRARQPRLGIVDVYDLDRQRQLILLRRDNVEHLLLVGGPNDVVVETNIIRVPGARLPNAGTENGERPEASPERLPEVPAARPIIDGANTRQAEQRAERAVAPGAGATELAPLRPATPLRAAVSARSGDPVQRPVALNAGGMLRPADRPRALPTSGDTAPTQRPVRAPSQPANQRLSNARDDEPSARGQTTELPPPSGEGGRLVPEPPPSSLPNTEAARLQMTGRREQGPGAAPARPRPEAVPRPQSIPANPDPVGGDQTASGPAGRGRVGGSPPSDTPAPPHPELNRAPPEGESPASSIPLPPPPPAANPPEPAPPPEPQPLPAPKPDPFSIEDIEAEFARLLGRPLDRKDNKS